MTSSLHTPRMDFVYIVNFVHSKMYFHFYHKTFVPQPQGITKELIHHLPILPMNKSLNFYAKNVIQVILNCPRNRFLVSYIGPRRKANTADRGPVTGTIRNHLLITL